MSWNSGGNDPTPGPWGSPGKNPPPSRPPNGRGPWGGSGGSGGPPDLDQMMARAQAWLRSVLPDGPQGPRRPPSRFPRMAGGRSLVLIAAVAIAVWLATGFYRVEPDEQGVVMRFGAFDRTALPGLNYHIPWPVETALTPAVTRINRIEVGFRAQPSQGQNTSVSANRDLTRDVPARDLPARAVPEESLMLTGDENIIDIDFAVFWRIRDVGDFLFNTRNPGYTVKSAAESVMREVIGSTPIQPALTEARGRIEQSVLTGAQAILDQYHAGVEITQVQLQKVDPPNEVIESFRDVQRANTDAERARNEAESYRNDIVPRARGDAARLTAEADGSRQASIAEAKGQAQRFLSVYAAYSAAKDVTMRRLYIETMQEILTHTPTVVVDDNVKGLLPLLQLGTGQPSAATPIQGAAK
jgi:membrane protease subunit HflK